MSFLISTFALLMPAISPPPLSPQGSGSCNLVEIWVDPVVGYDPVPCNNPPCFFPDPINNPSAPAKTIQAAIDKVYGHLVSNYDAISNPDQEAIVHLMPGVYGPTTAFNGMVGNGESLPISMRDRVHVRGVNARRCVIRGLSVADPDHDLHLREVLWPFGGVCTTQDPKSPASPAGYWKKQVLVDFTLAGRLRIVGTPPNSTIEPAPWSADPFGETAEILDGVTLQGGEVQVYVGMFQEFPFPQRAVVSNCLFDMRSSITVEGPNPLSGPQVGIELESTWADPDLNPYISGMDGGYALHEVQLLGDTFLMAEFVQPGGWLRSRPGAVAVLDVCDPLCNVAQGDLPDKSFRGVNRAGIQNCLFRTHTGGLPVNTAEMATVGVTDDDSKWDSGGGFVDTNAFAVARTGALSFAPGNPPNSLESDPAVTTPSGSSLDFTAPPFSLPLTIPLYTAVGGAPAPTTPAIPLWDGDASLPGSQFDPAFVGEYVRTLSPAKGTYRDWRLLPGSALQDAGRWSSTNDFANSASFVEDTCADLATSVWDHEGYGNPRIVDGFPDIGFDEVHLSVMAGSYANHSYSHNRAGTLNSQVVDEQDTRFLFLRETEPGSPGALLMGRTLRFASNEIIPGSGYRAWTRPPGSLTAPSSQASSLPGYDLLYTTTTPTGQLPWMKTYTSVIPAGIPWPNWQAAPHASFVLNLTTVTLPADDEGPGFDSWVNSQAIVLVPGSTTVPVLYGAMQPEYR